MGTDGVQRVVIVLRHPSRAVRLAEALRSADLTPLALPLTDTELPADTESLHDELDALREGRYEWLVVTSGNAVRALALIARHAGTTLADVLREGNVRVGTVGAATAQLLAGHGIAVDLVPARSSSRGLLEAFGEGPGSVLLPQADLAPDDLLRGLTDLRWSVHRVVAYRTVPFPAEAARAVTATPEEGAPPPLVRREDVPALTSTRVQPVVVFLAPSAVRQFRERLGGKVPPLPVAIGETTARALLDEGWRPAAIASDPSPEAVVRAVLTAFGSAPEASEPSTRPLDPASGDRP